MLGMHGELEDCEKDDLNVPAKYQGMIMELIEFSRVMTDTLSNIDRAVDRFRKEGHYTNKANMEEVFESNLAQKLIIREKINGQTLTKVKTVVFKMD